jgi:hypothetical protein
MFLAGDLGGTMIQAITTRYRPVTTRLPLDPKDREAKRCPTGNVTRNSAFGMCDPVPPIAEPSSSSHRVEGGFHLRDCPRYRTTISRAASRRRNGDTWYILSKKWVAKAAPDGYTMNASSGGKSAKMATCRVAITAAKPNQAP